MSEKPSPSDIPLVYSCSGCSTAAQMANDFAIKLDRTGQVEMSCIAGVGGDVASLVKVATSGRRIIALDGCPLACAKSCLARHQVVPDVHFELSDFKIKKLKHQNFDPEQASMVFEQICDQLTDSGFITKKPERSSNGK
ncbi:MAG: putative zinc-binding protein [Bdellovibrionaceae bacterium]|nr:putative zinc-binding protein [Pseudobdellovibrionaceae bacterium]